jgi:ligand-binding SRPBCC domain-containing protein
MHVIKTEQLLPISLDEAWRFFATPNNLNAITPPDMKFEILSEVPAEMYEGLLITYTIKPFLNIPMRWVTEITHIKSGQFFVDEQRIGPYRIWHHEHHFKQVEGGVLMTDIVSYDIGKSILGWLAGILFVHKMVKGIFTFREKRLKEIFV